jgi:hypothetical protein
VQSCAYTQQQTTTTTTAAAAAAAAALCYKTVTTMVPGATLLTFVPGLQTAVRMALFSGSILVLGWAEASAHHASSP